MAKTRDRILLTEIETAQKRENERRDGGGDYPCVSCGKAIKTGSKHRWVHLCDGGSALRLPMPAEGCDTPGACLACYPIGEACWRRLLKTIPDLARFEEKVES